MTTQPTAICAFCGRPGVKMSNEHVLPQWLSKIGRPIAGEYIMDRGGKEHRSKIMQVTTHRVCVDCNTGWMHRIEDSTIPVLTPILEATTSRIKEIDRWVIARWFTKTILTAQLAMTARDQAGPLHPQDYRTFYEHCQPFQNQFTLIGGYSGPVLPIIFDIHSPDETTNRGVRAFFHFHRVVLLTFFMNMQGPSNILLPTGITKGLHVLWPTQREIGPFSTRDPTMALSWPPNGWHLDATSIDALNQSQDHRDPSEDASPQDSHRESP